MKSAVENLEPTRAKLTVEVPLAELQPSVDHAYSHIASQVNIPGFRRGKVPPRIIDQRVGKGAVMEHAINEALPGLYRQAVTESELKPLGQPEIEVTAVPGLTDEADDLIFTAELDVRPEIELPDLESLTITVESTEVTDEDIEERLTSLREQHATLAGVDRAAQDGDFVTIDLKATIGDDEIDSVSGVSYQIGSGNMLDGMDEALTGLSADETTTFTAPLAGGDRAGQDAQITVTPTAIKVQELPEVDDEFAQTASEFDTVEELRENLRTQVAEAKENNRAVTARDQLLEQLVEATDFPLPAKVIEAEVHQHLENENRLEDDEHRAEVTEETTSVLKRQLLLDTLAEKVSVSVGQNELLEFLLRTAQQYQQDPSEFIRQADENGQIPLFVAELTRNKSLAVALRQVKVVDSAGDEVDLSAYIGSDEEDAAAAAAAQDEAPETETVDVTDAAESEDTPAEAASDEENESESDETAKA
ncbi:trigger factor [Ruania alkalisoli]|uniref:Trigger factor n=1 Tax=Ruania alkalisoli TaxID=2779775 RepID=A0A7M1SZC7_9MICO|nr:trigger factor [Ruania alkalisoli]QOR71993.1 trigger factor [Ruania alkalisoli]